MYTRLNIEELLPRVEFFSGDRIFYKAFESCVGVYQYNCVFIITNDTNLSEFEKNKEYILSNLECLREMGADGEKVINNLRKENATMIADQDPSFYYLEFGVSDVVKKEFYSLESAPGGRYYGLDAFSKATYFGTDFDNLFVANSKNLEFINDYIKEISTKEKEIEEAKEEIEELFSIFEPFDFPNIKDFKEKYGEQGTVDIFCLDSSFRHKEDIHISVHRGVRKIKQHYIDNKDETIHASMRRYFIFTDTSEADILKIKDEYLSLSKYIDKKTRLFYERKRAVQKNSSEKFLKSSTYEMRHRSRTDYLSLA